MAEIVCGDSIEAVAFALYEQIRLAEAHTQTRGQGAWYPGKDWVLETYRECLRTVKLLYPKGTAS